MNIFYDYQSIFRQKFGGVTRYHYELFKEVSSFDDVNAKCKVFASPNYYFSEIFARTPIYNVKLPRGIAYHLNRVSNYSQIISGEYDIIHPTWYDPYCWVKKNQGKYVVTIHDMIHEKFSGFSPIEIEGKKFWIHHADRLIAVSENTKRDIMAIYPEVDEKKIDVIYHGKNSLPRAEEVVGCPNQYILYIGNRTYEYKNFYRLLEAFRYLVDRNIINKLVCVGGGAFSEYERKQISERKLEDNIVQLQATDAQMAYLYSHAECFVYPSMYEGFGFPILEAFECDCPAIVSKSSSLPEVAGEAAVYFDPYSIEELIEQIVKVLEDSALRRQLSNKGKARLGLFSWKKTGEETIKVYKELI